VTILKQAHIVGCTTTGEVALIIVVSRNLTATIGAAKVVSLLSVRHLKHLVCNFAQILSNSQGMQPKAMIVEEAGQVLEPHILASLVQSVEQIVMIGDPLQLRPNINNYSS
jgi:hypothetical protein